ncbi:MAG: hypothetical protein GY715_11145 [Planctomycetes bacterium]|nr:hypothetical protein [Planctomycetota bacterium]
MDSPGALERFAPRLHPAIVADVRTWSDDPELGKLHASLDAHPSFKSFLDTYAEAVVARHLRARGCGLAFEVPTPSGRACDFEVTVDGQQCYLHVKRADTEPPRGRRLTISSRLRYLERIERPYVVSVRWHEGVTDTQMQRLVRSAREFITHAHVGDELVVHDDDGREIGGVLIVAPWEGPHVSLAIGLPTGFIDEVQRMRKLLRRAHRQFMPRAVNVILVCSSNEADGEDFEDALLGSHVERWDAFPPRGRRIAHGRASDGLWHGHRYADSRVAGWFRLVPEEDGLGVRLLFREESPVEPEFRTLLERMF